MSVRVLQITALAAFFCASARAAPLQIPTNVPIVEVLQQTNSYNYTPVNETNSTIKRTVPISDALVTGQSVSDVEPKVSTTRRLPIGNGADVTAHVKIPKTNIARGLIKAAKLGVGGVGGIVAGLAAEALLDYGISKLGLGDDGSLSGEYKYSGEWWANQYGKFEGAKAACDDLIKRERPTAGNIRNAKFTGLSYTSQTVAYCNISLQIWDGTTWVPATSQVGTVNKSTSPGGGRQDIEDLIAQSQGWPSSSARALQGMLGEPSVRPAIFTPGLDQNLTLQGPNSATGKTTKTTQPVQLLPGTNTVAPPGTPSAQTQPGTQTTTTTTTHPITYSGSSVSYTSNNTTNNSITNNVTNVTTNETKTEEVKDDKQPDQCQKYPNTIGCKEVEFDTPEGEIPRKQIDVSWSPVDLGLGGGSCPAPVQLYDNKQFSYQLACDNLLLIKTMVIAIALFVGGMIIFGGRADQ